MILYTTKRIIFTLLSIYFFVLIGSCSSRDSVKNEHMTIAKRNLETYLKAAALDDPSQLVIDSIRILRIDTLNEMKDSMQAVMAYLHKVQSIAKYRAQIVRDASSEAELAMLSRRIGSKSEFFESRINESVRVQDQLKQESEDIYKHALKIDSLVKRKVYDSLTTTGYSVLLSVFAHDAKMSNKNIDSIALNLDRNFFVDERIQKKSTFVPSR